MTLLEALKLADYYGGDQVFGDERDEMSTALVVLAAGIRDIAVESVLDKYLNREPNQ